MIKFRQKEYSNIKLKNIVSRFNPKESPVGYGMMATMPGGTIYGPALIAGPELTKPIKKTKIGKAIRDNILTPYRKAEKKAINKMKK